MLKKDTFENMVPEISRYLNRYSSKILHASAEELQQKAKEIYKTMYSETPKIGGSNNPMASNLYEFMTFCAYYEASEHKIGEDAVPVICEWMLEKRKWIGKIMNLNIKFSVWLMDNVFKSVAKKTAKKKANGEWGNTWTIEYNPDAHTEGVSYVLSNCPLFAFAKAHGYEKMLPTFCKIDHNSAALMHGKLIRFKTEATGDEFCDYWFVGDQSETAKKYIDIPIK